MSKFGIIRADEDKLVLNSFAKIAPQVILQSGITTAVSECDAVAGIFKWHDDKEFRFGVYSLSQFLNQLSLHGDTDAIIDTDVDDNTVVIMDKDGKAQSSIRLVPEKIIRELEVEPELPMDEAAMLVLSKEDLDRLSKASSNLDTPQIEVSVVGDKVTISTVLADDGTANRFSIEKECENKSGVDEFSGYFEISNVGALVRGNYNVHLWPMGLSIWDSLDIEGLKYILTFEQ